MNSYFKVLFLTLFLVCPLWINAQAWGDILGARMAGMNNTSVALQDLWNASANPAGIIGLKVPMVGINYSSKFSLKELSTKSIAGLYPVQWGVWAVNMNYFGSALYHETKASLVYARKLNKKLSAGVHLDYLTIAFGEGYGASSRMTFGVGIQYSISKDLTLGAYVYNPIGIRHDTLQSFTIPFLFRTGLAYAFSDLLLTTVETEYNSLLSFWNVRAGIEYHPNQRFAFRTGVGLRQEVFSFGMGYHWKQFAFDVASTLHQQLGMSPQFSVIYNFR